VPEAPVISTVVTAQGESNDEGSTSEGSSIEPGERPGETHGAMRLSQLRRR